MMNGLGKGRVYLHNGNEWEHWDLSSYLFIYLFICFFFFFSFNRFNPFIFSPQRALGLLQHTNNRGSVMKTKVCISDGTSTLHAASTTLEFIARA